VDQQKEAAHMRQMTLTIIFLALVGCSTEMQRLTAQREAPATFVFELRNDGEGACSADLERKATHMFELRNDGEGTCTIQW